MILRVLFLLLLTYQFGVSQLNQPKAVVEDENSEFVLKPNDKVSTGVQQQYADLMQKLYADRNMFFNNLNKLIQAKESELVEPQKDIEKLNQLDRNIKAVEKELNDIRFDIKSLSKEYEGETSDNQVLYLIKKIKDLRYPYIKTEEELTANWNDEFKEMVAIQDNTPVYVSSDCKLAFNGIDPSTLQQKIQTQSENLITYTHSKLEQYYKEDSFLTGDVSLIELGKDKYLTIEIIIRSRDAIRNYGMIQIGSPLKIELINGESVYLFAQSNAEGRPIPQTNNVSYRPLYLIAKSEYKLLKSSEIDNLGIMWSSGYEKYDIYNIDVVKNQIECLENY